MGQQSEIFARYRSLFNSKTVQPTESEQSRKLDELDFVDFLFELVKATKGQKQFKNIILKGSLTQLKNVDSLNATITDTLFSAFGCDSTVIIQTQYTTKSATGIEIQRSEIDNYGLLGINPNDTPGKYLYEGNDVTKHVNYFIYSSQGVTETNPLEFKYLNRTLFTIYASTPNTLVFKFGEYYENKPYGEWLTDYLKVSNPILNTVNFTTILADIITGSISLKASKNKIEIRENSALITALKKIFGFCSESTGDGGSPSDSANKTISDLNAQITNSLLSNPSGVNNTGNAANINQNPFDFNFNDLDEINRDADLKSRGKINFVTCNNLELDINPDDVLEGLDALFGSAADNTVYSYDGSESSEMSSTNIPNSNGLYDNSLIQPNLDNTTNFFDNVISNGAKSALNSGETNLVIDLPNINSELQLNILKAIPYALIQMVVTPKIVMVPKLYYVLSGNNSTLTTSDYINQMTGIIQTIGTKITELLIKNIVDSIKSDLIKLAKELAVQFLKQRGMDYLATLSSLLGLLSLFQGGNSGCGGVINSLLKLLKLSNFGPMPQIPPPLVYAGGFLKPGLNQVAIVNDIKSKLNEKGIGTAPTLADGSPNNMMIAIEETVKVMVNHIKTNAHISVMTIGTPIMQQGYGQIQ
jgi:hypothetical protein